MYRYTVKWITIFISLSLVYSLSAQVKGNKNIVSKSYDIHGLKNIEIGLYANITINAQGDDKMTITADENILPLIDHEIVDGKMDLRQKEWIEGNERIEINMEVSSLERIIVNIHEDVVIKNLSQEKLVAMAILGRITLSGELNSLNANGESGDIDATDLDVDDINVNFWGDGGLLLRSAQKVKGLLKGNSEMKYAGRINELSIKKKDNAQIIYLNEIQENSNSEAEWIHLKIKNNSSRRLQAYVKGPKPEGKYFSYGFPMNAGQVRKERWTVGTKVFKMGAFGTKKLLVKLTKADADQVVNLY